MKETVLSFLKRNTLATLVTLNSDMSPHATPLYVYVDGKFNCYCVTKESTQKYKNIQGYAKVSVSFLDKTELSAGELSGSAYIVNVGEEVGVAISQLQEVMSEQQIEDWLPPVAQLEGTQYAVLKIIPTRVTYTNYKEGADSKPVRIELGM